VAQRQERCRQCRHRSWGALRRLPSTPKFARSSPPKAEAECDAGVCHAALWRNLGEPAFWGAAQLVCRWAICRRRREKAGAQSLVLAPSVGAITWLKTKLAWTTRPRQRPLRSPPSRTARYLLSKRIIAELYAIIRRKPVTEPPSSLDRVC